MNCIPSPYRRLAALWLVAASAFPWMFATSVMAQQSAAPASATQSDPGSASSENQIGEIIDGRPPRPAISTPETTPIEAISVEGETGVSSSSWSDPETSKEPIEEDHELSVEPGQSQLLPEDAPAWVGSSPDLTDDVHRLFVGGHIAELSSEAAEGLDTPLVEAVNQYIDAHLLGRDGAARTLRGKITADYIWKNLVDDRIGYTARLNTPGQPMYQKWVTVSLTPEQRATILRWDREVQQRDRLAPIGLGLTGLLGGVGLLHLILRRGNR